MSDFCVTVVRIDPLDVEAMEQLAVAVSDRLRAEGILAAPYHGLPPVLADDGERLWTPGPELAAQTLAPDLPVGGQVGVSDRREMHHACCNMEPLACRVCGTTVGDDEAGEAILAWLEVAEPDLTCRACGWQAPYSGWACDFPSAVGGPAVSFHHITPAPPLLDHVRDVLGGRSVVVYVHL